MRSRERLTGPAVVSLLVAATTVLVGARPARAECVRDLFKAAGKYAACEQKTLGQAFVNLGLLLDANLSKCRTRYTIVWPKLQAKASSSGTICENDRFQANGDGTVTDRLTGLQWEQKTDDGSVHDKDDTHTWTDSDTPADGTAFTSFLATLNDGCFAGQCDWRLPTIAELQTILSEPYPCTTYPLACVDAGLFGPTVDAIYWSSTTNTLYPTRAWYLEFRTGRVGGRVGDDYGKNVGFYVRAVRGGL